MADEKILQAVKRSRELLGDINENNLDTAPILWQLIKAGELISPWYTAKRDWDLDRFWRSASHISSAYYNAISKLSSIPWRIVPRDPSIVSHIDQAEELTYVLKFASEFGKSFDVARQKWMQDYVALDNGGFMEVLGNGDPLGPIKGTPWAVVHRSGLYCTRTSSYEYPVNYRDPRNYFIYRLHFARVIYASQLPSSDPLMNDVGFGGISRAIYFAQYLHDILIYRAEQMGSRPKSKLILGKGITAKNIMTAFALADRQMDNAGLSRYSKLVAIGSEDTDVDIKVEDISSLDLFEEETATSLGMFGISLALGMPAAELWPAARGAGKADSAMQNLQARGKLPAQTVGILNDGFDFKFLPRHLMMTHDFIDDEQDQQTAIIRDIRGRNRQRDTDSEVITIRAARQNMVRDGDIGRDQFVEMELDAGRLEDGSPVVVLFYSQDVLIAPLLNLGVEDVTDTESNGREEMLKAIAKRESTVLMALAGTSAARQRKKLAQCLAALKWLRGLYQFAPVPNALRPTADTNELNPEEEPEDDEPGLPAKPRQPGNENEAGSPDTTKDLIATGALPYVHPAVRAAWLEKT